MDISFIKIKDVFHIKIYSHTRSQVISVAVISIIFNSEFSFEDNMKYLKVLYCHDIYIYNH